MVAANFDPSILQQGDYKKNTLHADRQKILDEVVDAWAATWDIYDELVLKLQAATSLTMDARANEPSREDPIYTVTSELMSKILRNAAGVRGNFLIGDAEIPTMSARVILETLIDMKFIIKDGTGELAKRFYYHSLNDFMRRLDESLRPQYSHLQDALEQAERQHGDLSRWALISDRGYNLRQRAKCVDMLGEYDGWYRKLSGTVHSSFIGMREFEAQGHYVLGASAQMMHRPAILIPLFSLFAFDTYRRGNKITVPNAAYYLRHFAKQHIFEMMASMPNSGIPVDERNVLGQAVQRIPQ